MTSSIYQMRMNMLDLQNFQVSKSKPLVKELIEEESSKENKEEKIFAKKGEDNYNKAMDFNGDGVVTYDEYMRYCEENAVSEYNSNPSCTFISTACETDKQVTRPVHIGRALDTYSHFGEEKFFPFIETEA